jgi:hypothetical protein
VKTSHNRPDIPSIQKDLGSKELELFQNDVLRPIIKQLHFNIIYHFSTYLSIKYKGKYFNIASDQQTEYVQHVFSKDSNYKLELKGMIIGQFTKSEIQYYAKQNRKIDKRIYSIVLERILGNQTELENT